LSINFLFVSFPISLAGNLDVFSYASADPCESNPAAIQVQDSWKEDDAWQKG
jgi:hypothetical protein